MDSWLVWLVFVIAFALLGFVGYHFTVRTLRFVALILAATVVVLVTRYGVTHPAPAATDLANSFTRGFGELSAAFFQPVLPGHRIPAPGRIGWLVIVVALIFGYRELEVWAMRWQPPTVDVSALGDDQKAFQNGDPPEGADRILTDAQRHDRLIAELKFRLPAVEVRAPAVLPGGTKPSGLASIVEDSGVTGSGLAGAIIRFFGMLWPNPRRFHVRVWVERGDGTALATGRGTDEVRVTVDLENLRTGETIATQTLATPFDDAAKVVAGYLAWSTFNNDPTTPPWCVGSVDGGDLAAMLVMKGQRNIPASSHDVQDIQLKRIQTLEGCDLQAGVARYELAQLYDLRRQHVKALRLHAKNRADYPRFFRGRYRLAMSLEMIANPSFQPSRLSSESPEEEATRALRESVRILVQCNVFGTSSSRSTVCKFLSVGDEDHVTGGAAGRPDTLSWPLPCEVRELLLKAAEEELQEVRKQLTFGRLIWASFLHRDERAIWMHYFGLTERQRFHDGVQVAGLLVTARQRLIEKEEGRGQKAHVTPNTKRALRIVDAVAGDSTVLQVLVDPGASPGSRRSGGAKAGTRWVPGLHRTPSWQAAYNTACLYAAVFEDFTGGSEKGHLAEKEDIARLAVTSLRRAVNPQYSEMQRPWDWISVDPDFGCVKSSPVFRRFLDDQERTDYPRAGSAKSAAQRRS